MLASAVARLPNALLLVLDVNLGVMPTQLSDCLVTATGSALAISATHEADGETEVTLANSGETPSGGEFSLAWRGTLATGGHLMATTVTWAVLAEVTVPESAEVEVWADDPHEPSRVWVRVV